MLCCLPILLTLDAVGWRAFQYIMLPFLLNGSFLATLVGNTLYLVAFVVYHYITFGGYTGAPDLALSCVVVGNKNCWLTTLSMFCCSATVLATHGGVSLSLWSACNGLLDDTASKVVGACLCAPYVPWRLIWQRFA